MGGFFFVAPLLLIRFRATIFGFMTDAGESRSEDAQNIADPSDSTAEAVSRREPAFNLPAIVLIAILACAAIHLLRLYVLTPDQDIDLLLRAAFIPIRYTGGYEWDAYAFTSPATYSLLHGGLAHLAVNVIWLAAFGSPLANRLGRLAVRAFLDRDKPRSGRTAFRAASL